MVDQKPLKTELAYYKSVSGSSVDGEPETNLMSQNPIATHSASPTVHTVRNRRVLDPSSASSSASDAGYEANSYPHTHKPAYSSTLSGSSTSKRPLSGFHDSTSTDRTRLGPPKATGHLQRPVSVHHAALTDKPSGNGYRRPRHQISQEHRNDREPVGAQSCHNENDDSRIHPSQSHSSATAYRAEHKTGTGRLLAMWVARELAGTEDMVKARRHELGALRQEAREHGHNRPTA
ncbi:unnamed protein product [Protopolystoma xenopodis]|uniref:Uncharacterized protein n=1 Tax=Protopolystoma xenopodis TaxID=117903 RepID=A0A448X5D1_9PLAT|nr:unnamed protein product [Protopolystoma xenopodis]